MRYSANIDGMLNKILKSHHKRGFCMHDVLLLSPDLREHFGAISPDIKVTLSFCGHERYNVYFDGVACGNAEDVIVCTAIDYSEHKFCVASKSPTARKYNLLDWHN